MQRNHERNTEKCFTRKKVEIKLRYNPKEEQIDG